MAPGRRSVLGALVLLPFAQGTAWGKAAGEIRLANIYWPGPGGERLHGLMAIPARARGRQPAILVLGDADTPARAAILLTRLAENGLIACTPRTALSPAALSATLTWLGGNRYTAGHVGVIGFGAGAGAVAALAASPTAPFAAAAIFADVGDRADAAPAILRLPALPPAPSLTSDTGLDRIAGLARAIAFFKDQLG